MDKLSESAKKVLNAAGTDINDLIGCCENDIFDYLFWRMLDNFQIPVSEIWDVAEEISEIEEQENE